MSLILAAFKLLRFDHPIPLTSSDLSFLSRKLLPPDLPSLPFRFSHHNTRA